MNFGKFWKKYKKEKGSRQRESRTEKQWHARHEAQLLRYEQYTNCMTNWPFHSNCVSLCHETECSTSSTTATADLLPPESWQWNRHSLNWYQNIWSIDKGQGYLTYMARRPNANSTHKPFHSAW